MEAYRAIGRWLAESGTSDVLGLVGFLTTVLGFGATLWNVKRSRRAAEAARDATVALRSRLALLDAVHRLAENVVKLDDVQERLGTGERRNLAGAVRVARRELAALREHRTVLSSEDQEMLQTTMTFLLELEGTLRSRERTELELSHVQDMQQRLLERTDALHTLLTRLHHRAGGNDHG